MSSAYPIHWLLLSGDKSGMQVAVSVYASRTLSE